MDGQVETREMNMLERSQDCGCGCGGAVCETARGDCGCGCGGLVCGAERQEVVFVASIADRNTSASAAKQCDCGCECCG